MIIGLRILAWAFAGAAFMAGCIAPVGVMLWIPATALIAVGLAVGARSLRYLLVFVVGTGLTLVVFGITNTTYITITFFGLLLVMGGATGFAAFGPRVSRAEVPPAEPDDGPGDDG